VLLTAPTGVFMVIGGMQTNVQWNSGRVPSGMAATNHFFLSTNGLSGAWLLLAAGVHESFTNYVWTAPHDTLSSACYYRVVQQWEDGTAYTNTSAAAFTIMPIPEASLGLYALALCALSARRPAAL